MSLYSLTLFAFMTVIDENFMTSALETNTIFLDADFLSHNSLLTNDTNEKKYQLFITDTTIATNTEDNISQPFLKEHLEQNQVSRSLSICQDVTDEFMLPSKALTNCKKARNGMCNIRIVWNNCPVACNTCPPICIDKVEKLWIDQKVGFQYCGYARNNKKICDRRIIKEKCPLSCNNCCKNKIGIIPFKKSLGPMTCESFKQPGNEKYCTWERILKSCPEACNSCETFNQQPECVDSKSPYVNKSCEDLARLSKIPGEKKYCNWDKVRQACIKSCGLCGSESPTVMLTTALSGLPSSVPSSTSELPTVKSSSDPSNQLSGLPTVKSSFNPSNQPSVLPTVKSSSTPSDEPSGLPTAKSSSTPSDEPSGLLTLKSSSTPSGETSELPTMLSSFIPSDQSSGLPTVKSSFTPSDRSSGFPTVNSSPIPSSQPSVLQERTSLEPTSGTSQSQSEPSFEILTRTPSTSSNKTQIIRSQIPTGISTQRNESIVDKVEKNESQTIKKRNRTKLIGPVIASVAVGGIAIAAWFLIIVKKKRKNSQVLYIPSNDNKDYVYCNNSVLSISTIVDSNEFMNQDKDIKASEEGDKIESIKQEYSLSELGIEVSEEGSIYPAFKDGIGSYEQFNPQEKLNEDR